MGLSKTEKIEFIMEAQIVEGNLREFRDIFEGISPKLATIYDSKHNELMGMMKDLWDAHYTDEEVDAYYDFFSSPIGKSISSKLPMILEQGKAIGEEWGKSIIIEAFPEYAKLMEGDN